MRWILRSMPNKNSGEKIKKKRTNNKKKGGGAGASSSRRRKRKAVEWKWRRRTQKKIESIRTDGKIKTKQKSTSAPITGRHGKRGVGNRFFFFSFLFFFCWQKRFVFCGKKSSLISRFFSASSVTRRQKDLGRSSSSSSLDVEVDEKKIDEKKKEAKRKAKKKGTRGSTGMSRPFCSVPSRSV